MNKKIIVALSVIVAILIVFTSYIGITTPDFYSRETQNWQTQSIGQDFINLYLITPSLLVTVLAYIKWENSILIWVGVMMYILYTYLIYCFNIHFNFLFLGYCSILGLSFYMLLYFFYCTVKENLFKTIRPYYLKITGIYFLSISVVFYLLWLSDIIPSIRSGIIPVTIQEAGVFTNPVHVIDLSLFLPGVFIIGVLVLRDNIIGFLFTPGILTFFILMNSTIGVLSLMLSEQGYIVTILMGILGLFSFVLLILNFPGHKVYESRIR